MRKTITFLTLGMAVMAGCITVQYPQDVIETKETVTVYIPNPDPVIKPAPTKKAVVVKKRKTCKPCKKEDTK